jgi:hypothetical protein
LFGSRADAEREAGDNGDQFLVCHETVTCLGWPFFSQTTSGLPMLPPPMERRIIRNILLAAVFRTVKARNGSTSILDHFCRRRRLPFKRKGAARPRTPLDTRPSFLHTHANTRGDFATQELSSFLMRATDRNWHALSKGSLSEGALISLAGLYNAGLLNCVKAVCYSHLQQG